MTILAGAASVGAACPAPAVLDEPAQVARDAIFLVVRQDHINRGVRNSSGCAIALAAREMLHRDVKVGKGGYLLVGDDVYRCEAAVEWIKRFDYYKPVHPERFRFEWIGRQQ